ncbi:unnamed protein product [Amaranthus hypochondriacus]
MELDSGADSVSSTPRALPNSDDKSVVRLMVSFGGKILPRPHDNQLRYVGGDTRIIAVNRSANFSHLNSKLSKLLSPSIDFTVKYQLPNEELDALITVSTDEDVENMMEEFDRLSIPNSNKIPRLRLFLFPFEEQDSRTSSIASLLDGSKKRESWFLDALNGGANTTSLERGRSEASSIVSEVPDYLFGLDTNSDEPPVLPTKFRNRSGLSEPDPSSAPGSPAFGSTSSVPAMPNLPPVKTKLEKIVNPVEDGVQPAVRQVWNVNPGSPYPAHAVQPVPVYYVPATGSGPGLVAHRNIVPVPVSVPGPQYVSQYGPGPVQVPVGYQGTGTGPMYEVPMQAGNMVQGQGIVGGMNQQGLYYGVTTGGMVAAYTGTSTGMGMPLTGEEDGSRGRNLQG